ncbi:hypothetical protein CEXT_219951 [Caerostris extrusa]|uniref:Uncharacterized protein n=1 Tax=Caerostris extrusa TaxID=172846 RepID=A0AAV4SFE4_CAEEX|nr:hypothetical protein CEXT_219951 [Caerostris extrusa]
MIQDVLQKLHVSNHTLFLVEERDLGKKREREPKPQDEGGAGRDSEFVTREHGGKTDAPAPPSPQQESPPPVFFQIHSWCLARRAHAFNCIYSTHFDLRIGIRIS